MTELETMSTSEKAYADYVLGMKYADISAKYNIPVNTLKTWKKRYKWTRSCTPKKGFNSKSVKDLGNILRNEIREDLITQLKTKEMYQKVYIDLVDDYMALWDIKNRLILDIREKGIYVEWVNGKQSGERKNESIQETLKVNTQMLKILSELDLKPSPKSEEDDDDDI